MTGAPPPTVTPRPPAPRSDREARLADSLRANLARRKAQARGRAGAEAHADPEAPDDHAGEGEA